MRDKTIRVAVAIDVRGKNNRRCGVGCWALFTSDGAHVCDAFHDAAEDWGWGPIQLRESKLHPGEYLRCRACRDAEVKG